MGTIINNRGNITTDPVRNFRFLVNFRPHNLGLKNALGLSATMGFTSVSGLSMNTEAIPYREGGYNTTVHQIPGQTTFAPITMQHGVMLGASQNWLWMKQLFSVTAGSPRKAIPVAQGHDFRMEVEIKVLGHPTPGSAVTLPDISHTETEMSANDFVTNRFLVYNAWISSLAYSDLNAGDNAIFVEQMSLAHEGFDQKWAKNWGTQAPAFV